ncbi:MAG TPA: hypothetical protein PK970_13210 [Hyphomicrobiaceae bacterium]|nr:hypothetical protein [Hyphomicrobiaceae bacterium]
MLADDSFQKLFAEATGSLERLLDGVRSVADVDIERGARFWRGRMTPRQANACPFECVLHTTQVFDLEMASLKAEGLPLTEAATIVALARAAIDGTVVVRHYSSAGTGLDLGREVRVPMPDGTVWTLGERKRPGRPALLTETIFQDRSFVPYTRR